MDDTLVDHDRAALVQERGPSELWLHLDVAGTEVQFGGMWS